MSCNKFLDTPPDNRTTLDSIAKVESLMRSAYPTSGYMRMAEITSDNYDEHLFPAFLPIHEELFFWQPLVTSGNFSSDPFWNASYTAIATANNALQTLDQLVITTPEDLAQAMALRGEALVARAYAHFMLLNLFCQHYSPTFSATDLGIPYILVPETTLSPRHERPSVAFVYEMIDKDLREGLPLLNDSRMEAPKYRMNQKAAYTFASRFYLFYEKWAQAEYWATRAIGENPTEWLRDWAQQATFANQVSGAQPQPAAVNAARTNLPCNFFIATPACETGLLYSATGNSGNGRFAHGHYVSDWEVHNAHRPWGPRINASAVDDLTAHTGAWLNPSRYQSANQQRVMIPTIPEVREISNPVAGTFVRRVKIVLFTAEEALLNRAEARVMQGNLDGALRDINFWVRSTARPPDSRSATHQIKTTLTETDLVAWVNSMEYYEPLRPSAKKRLNPCFPLNAEQTVFIHNLLFMRRWEFTGTGMRLFDIKRYGIQIERRKINSNISTIPTFNSTTRIMNSQAHLLPNISLYNPRIVAEKRSPRLVIQLPPAVIAAGMTPNPINPPAIPGREGPETAPPRQSNTATVDVAIID